MITRNSNGEIADLPSVSQFEPGETQSACGPFAVALCKYAGPATKGARGSAEDVDVYADNVYDKIFGGHDISIESGVVPDQIHQMLLDAGLHYQDLTGIGDNSQQANDIRSIKAALDQGYLVIGEIAETSVVDQEFGGSPYYWNGAGLWHYVVYSGYTDSALLTHDGANINGVLNGANSPRPQPRHYDNNQIQNRWATIVWTDWLPMMPANFDPTQQQLQQEDDLLQLTDPIGSFFSQAGQSWACKQNNIEIQGAILVYYRQIQGACRLPVTPEQYNVPGVVWQRFESGILVYDPTQKLDGFTGHNHTYLIKLDSDLAKQITGYTSMQASLSKANTDKAVLTQQVTDLQKQLAAATSNANVQLLQQQNTALQTKLQQIKILIG